MPSTKTSNPTIDAFGVLHSPDRKVPEIDLNSDKDRFLSVVQPVLVGDGNTEPKEVSKTDIYETTQSFKDQTGYAGMMNMIKSGKAFPIEFMDDGKHSGDVSNLPDNINDLHTSAVASKAVYDGALDKQALEAYINDLVAAATAKASAEKAASDTEVSK